MARGLLFTISGPSGVGKGDLCKMFCARHPEVRLSQSCTTREPRAGEVESGAYRFLSVPEFQRMIEENQFLEYNHHFTGYYGTPRDFVERTLEEGHDVLLEIEVEGSMKVMQQYPQTVGIFIVPPSYEELHRRLKNRASETPEKIATRLGRARRELRMAQKYDYIILNDVREDAVARIEAAFAAAHLRLENNQEMLEEIINTFPIELDDDK